MDKKLSDCNDIAKYIGGLIDVERARCQWVEKMLLKFPSELLCEGSLMNAAWDSVHTWTSAILTEANDRTRTLKEFKERFESNIITWDQTRKKVIKIAYLLFMCVCLFICLLACFLFFIFMCICVHSFYFDFDFCLL